MLSLCLTLVLSVSNSPIIFLKVVFEVVRCNQWLRVLRVIADIIEAFLQIQRLVVPLILYKALTHFLKLTLILNLILKSLIFGLSIGEVSICHRNHVQVFLLFEILF